MSRAVLAPF